MNKVSKHLDKAIEELRMALNGLSSAVPGKDARNEAHTLIVDAMGLTKDAIVMVESNLDDGEE